MNTDDYGFVWLMLFVPTFPLAVTPLLLGDYLVGGLGTVIISVPVSLAAATLYVRAAGPIERRPNEWGRVSTFVATRLLGMRILGCGCAHATGNFSQDRPGHDVVEEEEFWVREDDGAKWRYVRWIEQLVRCEQCGRHRYRRGEYGEFKTCYGDLTSKRVWKDEEQPTFDAEITSADLVEAQA